MRSVAEAVLIVLAVSFLSLGVRTGIDLERLFAAREALQAGVPQETIYGMTPLAGLTRDFVYADGRRPRQAPPEPQAQQVQT